MFQLDVEIIFMQWLQKSETIQNKHFFMENYYMSFDIKIYIFKNWATFYFWAKDLHLWERAMTVQFNEIVALIEVDMFCSTKLGELIPTCNFSSSQSDSLFWLPQVPTLTTKSYTHMNINKILIKM